MATMDLYYRPIPMSDRLRPDNAMPLAGGWCWFSHAECLDRDRSHGIVPLSEIPDRMRATLSAPRGSVAGLGMHAPRLMGILNTTPDSFSDGGHFADQDRALAQARRLVQDGADILDIGGESTRPGAEFVPAELETSRTAPVIAALADEMQVPISIDTRKADVAKAALGAGAVMLNDVSAGDFDAAMVRLAAESGAPICLMHAQGDPKTMQEKPSYDNILLDVFDFLAARIAVFLNAGVALDRIVIDPGIGFGKTMQHNLTLLRNLSLFHGLGCPILLGASRKRFIGTIANVPDPAARAPGSVAVALAGMAQGVQITRVHDMAETRQAARLWQAVTGTGI